MIKLNRTTEYGLMALRHMNRKQGACSATETCAVTSAREIADSYGLPFEITAKTLQRLKDTGLIQSAQGAKGGYTLQRSLEDVTLAEFIKLMEGPQSVVVCAGAAATSEAQPSNPELKVLEPSGVQRPGCEYNAKCEIKGLMGDLNHRLYEFLSGIRLTELAGK